MEWLQSGPMGYTGNIIVKAGYHVHTQSQSNGSRIGS